MTLVVSGDKKLQSNLTRIAFWFILIIMKEELEKTASIEDPVKRRAAFLAVFSRELVLRGGSPPIVVGGEALELYTQGSYTTGDIDIKAPLDLTKAVLEEWGFKKRGRTWFSKELDIYIDWLGDSLAEGREAEDRVVKIKIAEDLEIRVVSVEDLIIDRLNAARWWGDVDSLMWARVLVGIKERCGEYVDLTYLRKRAQEEDIEDCLSQMIADSGLMSGGENHDS
ncbi:MAG: hypothetical protein HYU64_17740 [Armatimonadetes bacterium]|nr:hypothetical protein [Armatimonadota bacterium]